MGKGPRRGAVAHVRRKVPIGYNDAPQIRPQKYPFPWTDPQIPPPDSSLDQPNGSWIRSAVFPQGTGQTDRRTHVRMYIRTDRPTDRPRESLMTIGRYAPRATRPNNTTKTRRVSLLERPVSVFQTALDSVQSGKIADGWQSYTAEEDSNQGTLRKWIWRKECGRRASGTVGVRWRQKLQK